MNTKYDKLFKSKEDTIFKDKSYLDPLKESEEIISRENQDKQIATYLKGINQNYLPPTLSIHGPPGTGKTFTTKKICKEFSKRKKEFNYAYVNLKDCRTIFSAANEILLELTGEKKKSYEGLDGVFQSIFNELKNHKYFVLVLDEIDRVKQDKNYDPNNFFYRLVRGDKKLKTDVTLSLFLISNELIEIDLKLDSRVKSVFTNESIFFPPYRYNELAKIIAPRLKKAIKKEALTKDVVKYGLEKMANRSGDIRKTLTVFREAGETANQENKDKLDKECIDENLEAGEKEIILDKLRSLPLQHFITIDAVTAYINTKTKEVIQPITSEELKESYQEIIKEDEEIGISDRALREIVNDLETMGLIETWIESKEKGRTKKIRTTFKPELVRKAINQYKKDYRKKQIK